MDWNITITDYSSTSCLGSQLLVSYKNSRQAQLYSVIFRDASLFTYAKASLEHLWDHGYGLTDEIWICSDGLMQGVDPSLVVLSPFTMCYLLKQISLRFAAVLSARRAGTSWTRGCSTWDWGSASEGNWGADKTRAGEERRSTTVERKSRTTDGRVKRTWSRGTMLSYFVLCSAYNHLSISSYSW